MVFVSGHEAHAAEGRICLALRVDADADDALVLVSEFVAARVLPSEVGGEVHFVRGKELRMIEIGIEIDTIFILLGNTRLN